MRQNHAVLADPVAASRASVISAVERVKQQQERQTSKEDTVPDCLLLRDETGVEWCITVNSKGELKAAKHEGKQDATPAIR